MFEAEARWIAKCLERASTNLNAADSRVLNLGSSTRHYREVQQPYINNLIFAPMRDKFTFVHADAKSGDGIDLSGDFCNPAFWAQIHERSYDAVICSNLLTHVFNRDVIIDNLKRITKEHSYLIVTSPFVYPYCSDPYDSKFRPNTKQLCALFNGFAPLEEVTVRSGDRHIDRLIANKRHLASFVANVALPRKGLRRWRDIASDVPNVFAQIQTSCVFLESHRRAVSASPSRPAMASSCDERGSDE